MLKIKIMVVDRTRSPFLKEGEFFYLDRLRKYAQVEWVEVKPVKMGKGRSEEEVLNLEGEGISRKIKPEDYLIALDRAGRQYGSEELSEWLGELSISVRNWVCFVVGGPLGLSNDIRKRAHSMLSLSKLTFTHEMSRLFLLEQLYRAFTIAEGQKYHK